MAGYRRLRRIVVLMVLLAGIAGASGAAAAPRKTSHVLVLYSSSRVISAVDEFQEALTSAVRDDPGISIEFHTEYIDELLGGGEATAAAMAEFLRQKYAGLKIDAVIGVSATAARMAAMVRERVFPDARLLYGAVDKRVIVTGILPPGTPGVYSNLDIRRAVEIALACHPGTKRVAYVLGNTEIELAWRQRITSEIKEIDPGLEVIDLAGLDADVLLERLAALPDATVVLWGSYFRDGAGVAYSPREIIGRASAASTAPIYGVIDYALGNGIVGGPLTSYSTCGDLTGQMLLQVLDSQRPGFVPEPVEAPALVAFDARQLERWGIPENRLPAGSVIRFQSQSAWEQYGWYVIGAASLLVAQMLLIAGLLVQRSRRLRAQQLVDEQFAFDRFVATLSARISDVSPLDVEPVLNDALEEARQQFGADRLSLFVFGDREDAVKVGHSAVGVGVSRHEGVFELGAYPEIADRLRRGELIRIDSPDDLEASMPKTLAEMRHSGVTSAAVVPLTVGGTPLGVLGLAKLGKPAGLSDEVAARLQILADVFANALGRKRSAEQIRKSSELSQAVIGSLSAQVCIIDREGAVVVGNDAWQRAMPRSGVDVSCALSHRSCGKDCETATSCSNGDTIDIRAGINAVLEGNQSHFSMEYRLTQPMGDTWHVVTAERLDLNEGGAVVSNQNVTARKRAELEAEQRRQELAHYSRVSAMGELAASLAHELNQPLTGVLTNAQAAVRFLDADPPNVTEVREILSDIIEDDRRAGEVIRRLRSMLQSGSVESVDVDLNEAVTNVVRLLASDAILRDVTIETVLEPGLAPVVGDRIQVQQVILNLIVNAMDAMRSAPERRVVIATGKAGPDSVRLSVSDTGPGIDHDKLGKVFQPFFTTKNDGLGMGLAIARTIVEAHGGVLWAENNPVQGATFLFKLPVSKGHAASA